MVSKFSIPFILLITFLTELVLSNKIVKRDASKTIEEILEEDINKYPNEAFDVEPAVAGFIQKVDRVNKLSKYRLSFEEDLIYERNSDDSKKDVIVFTEEEDKILFKKSKRFYIVLRRLTPGNGVSYQSSVAILRDATDQDKDVVTINGKSQVIEWTYFDIHWISGRTNQMLVTYFCASSLLIACSFNHKILTPPDKYLTSPRYEAKVPLKESRKEISEFKFKTEDGSDPMDNYEFFYDLEISNKIQQGRGFMGNFMSQGLVAGVMNAANGVVCIALLVIGMCGKQTGKDYIVIEADLGKPLAVEPQPVGPGGSGTHEAAGRRRKRNVDAGDDKFLDYPGWKTQYVNPIKGIYLTDASEIFYGFGNCPHQNVKASELSEINDVGGIIKHYLKVLRADCLFHTEALFEAVIKEGIISVSSNDKIFQLNSESKQLANSKLKFKDLQLISSATEIAAFSETYKKEVDKGENPFLSFSFGSNKRETSRSIHFIVQVGLNYLKLVREKARHHIIHLTRNLILSTNNIFNKLCEDNQNLRRCVECTKDQEINFNDRIFLIGLRQFIKYGLGPVERGSDVFKAFETFINENEEFIEKYVNAYS